MTRLRPAGSRSHDGRGASLPTGSTALLLGVGVAEASLLALLAWWPGAGVPWPGFLLFGAAFLLYGAGATLVDRDPGEARWPRIGVIWAVGIAARLAILPVAPELSDDFWRYLWDGHVQLSGINPYLHAPASPALDSVATAWRSLVNNPTVPTIYPPVAQLGFLLVAATGGGILGLKLLWLAFDLGAAWLLGRAAAASGRPRPTALVLWLWSPLLLVETAWNGHLEALGLFGLALLLVLAGPDREELADRARRRRAPSTAGAGAALGWAALTKLAPLAALPPLARRLGPRFVTGAALFAAVLVLPWAGAGPDLVEGLGTYARHWRFNELGFAVIELLVPGEVAPRAVAAGVVVGVVALATVRRFGPERALLWVLGAGLLVSPTLHPWYALWILPVAVVRRSVPWLLFTGTAFVGYWGLGAYQETGVWPQPLWGRLVLWLPVLVLLAVERVPKAVPAAPRAVDEARDAEP